MYLYAIEVHLAASISFDDSSTAAITITPQDRYSAKSGSDCCQSDRDSEYRLW